MGLETEDDKASMLRAIMPEKQYGFYSAARDAGINTYDYVEFLDVLSECNPDSYLSRKELYAALEHSGFVYSKRKAIWESYREAGYWKTGYDSFRP